MATIDPLAVATSGYLDSNGNTDCFLVAVDGYGLEIIVTPEPDGGFDIRIKEPQGPLPGGGAGGFVRKAPEPYSVREEEEIIAIIKIFLEHASKGLFD